MDRGTRLIGRDKIGNSAIMLDRWTRLIGRDKVVSLSIIVDRWTQKMLRHLSWWIIKWSLYNTWNGGQFGWQAVVQYEKSNVLFMEITENQADKIGHFMGRELIAKIDDHCYELCNANMIL